MVLPFALPALPALGSIVSGGALGAIGARVSSALFGSTSRSVFTGLSLSSFVPDFLGGGGGGGGGGNNDSGGQPDPVMLVAIAGAALGALGLLFGVLDE